MKWDKLVDRPEAKTSGRRIFKTNGKQMKITAIARNLQNLEGQLNKLNIACGNAGSLIAKEVIQNNGKTDVDLGILLLATDNDDGACVIFDNFLLIDAKTQQPLIYSLLKHYKNTK